MTSSGGNAQRASSDPGSATASTRRTPVPPSEDASRPSSSEPAGTRSRANSTTRRSPTGTVATTSEPTAAAAKAGAARCETLRVNRMSKPFWTRTAKSGSNRRTTTRRSGRALRALSATDRLTRSSLVAATTRPGGVDVQLAQDLGMPRIADEHRDPGGPGGRHEPAVVADLDRDDRHATSRDPERDAVADRPEPDHDDVVVDAARDRPPAERLEQPRADERVGDERVDDGHDRRADEAQEDRVDAQGRVARCILDVGGQRRPGQERDRVRHRVERRQVRPRPRRRSPNRPPGTKRIGAEPQQPLLRRGEAGLDGPEEAARDVGRPEAGAAAAAGRRPRRRPADRGRRRRSGPGRSAAHPAAARRFGRRAGRRSRCSSPDLASSPDPRDDEEAAGQPEPACRSRRRWRPTRSPARPAPTTTARPRRARAPGCATPSSWSNIRMTVRIRGFSSTAASAAFRLARSSSPVRTIDPGGLDVGLAQDARQPRIADDEPDAAPRRADLRRRWCRRSRRPPRRASAARRSCAARGGRDRRR